MKRIRVSRIVLIAACAAVFHVAGMVPYTATLRDGIFKIVFAKISALSDSQFNDAQTQEGAAKILALEQENQELRQEKGIVPAVGVTKVLTQVLWFEPSPGPVQARIDHGTDSGIAQGAVVTAPGGILVGRVRTVFPHSARIGYMDDPSFTISVSIGAKNILGIAKPDRERLITVDFVPRENLPQVGDEVRTAGKGDLVPKGLLVGKVGEAVADPKEPFARIVVKPELDPYDTRILLVYLAAP